jgi:hypothetical protein
MDCPSCGCEFADCHHQCPDCGFSLTSLSNQLGSGMVRLERLTDAAHCLRLREFRQIETLLDDFQRRFPQVYLALFLGVLPGRLNLRELSFWLLNKAAFGGPDQRRLNEYAILMAIDPAAKTVGLTVGYALEEVFPERRLNKVLQAMRTELWHGEYARAIERGIAAIDKRLRGAARCVLREDEILPPEAGENFLDEAGLHVLRADMDPTARRREMPNEGQL